MLLFTIKALHSVIILYMMYCLYIIWHYALTGVVSPFTRWAFLSVIAEGLVFIAYNWECPLTIWALNLGDDTGSDLLSDILYLEEVEFATNFAIFFVIGTMLSIRKYLRKQKYQHDKNTEFQPKRDYRTSLSNTENRLPH